MFINVYDKFINQEEINFVLNFYNLHKEKATEHNKTRPLDIQFTSFLNNKINSIAKKINNSTIDWAQIVKWPKGTFQNLHLDTTSAQTTLTSICFLNDDFKGGELFLEDGTLFKPIKGRIVFFDGMYFKHGVKKIKEGTRHTIAIWYKKNAIN